MLIARLSADETMIDETQNQIRDVIKSSKYTPKGLIFINEWGVLRHACNHAFLALVTAKDRDGKRKIQCRFPYVSRSAPENS